MAPKRGEFVIVTLPGDSRRCLECVSANHGTWVSSPHNSDHRRYSASGRHLPQRWLVVGEVSGEPLPIGSGLRLVGARHQVFFEYGGMDSVEWLFEVVDGGSAGGNYYVSSSAWHEADRSANNYFDVPWDAPVHPLWPKGLEAIR
jgi:hypothetical protein